MNLAPIALFAYNRPKHLQRTVEALKKNELADKSELFIYSDGTKDLKDSKKNGELGNNINQVRKYAKSIDGFKKVNIIEREENLSLANSLIAGISEVVNDYPKIIVLEDDLLTSQFFLSYMNKGLNLYEDEDKIISINAYMYNLQKKLPETYFLRYADCWGWATWKNKWELFETDAKKLLHILIERKLVKTFDSIAYTGLNTDLLTRQSNNKANSWAIRWHASAFLNNMLSLYPRQSLVQHIGNDGTGTNVFSKDKVPDMRAVELYNKPINLYKIPINENLSVGNAIIRYKRKFRRKQIGYLKDIESKLYKIYKTFFNK